MSDNKASDKTYSPVIGIMKIAGCIMVIYSHAYALSDRGLHDPVWRCTKGDFTAGSMAVSFFFFVSGFFITKSLLGGPEFRTFFKKRALKIFPSLIFVTVVTVFVLGPFVTSLTIGEYFSNSDTYLYLLNCFGILRHDLPGVFENNVYNSTVNGALWTIPVELVCYVCSYVGNKSGFLNKKYFGWIAFAVFSVYVLDGWVHILPGLAGSFLLALLFYCIGTAAYLYDEYIDLKVSYVFVALALLLLSMVLPSLFRAVYVFAMPYISLWLFRGVNIPVNEKMSRIGNISYPVYLCGFPIQQTIVWIYGGRMDHKVNFLLSLFFAIVIGTAVYFAVLWITEKIRPAK